MPLYDGPKARRAVGVSVNVDGVPQRALRMAIMS